jgi:hypothetical protein
VAYGNFTQSPGDYIKYSKVHQFESESASIIFLIFNTAKTIRHLELKPIIKHMTILNTIRQRLLTTLFLTIQDQVTQRV